MPTPPRSLLLIHDAVAVDPALETRLRADGWQVHTASIGELEEDGSGPYRHHAVVLSIGATARTSVEWIRGLRAVHDTVAVIAITPQGSSQDRIACLDAGADDCLVRPVDLDELVARLRAVLRRQLVQLAGELRLGRVRLDISRRAVFRDGEPVKVSAQEFRTLLALAQRAGRVVSRRELEDAVYGWNAGIDSNAIEVFVHQLRRKLGSELIQTVRGFGYSIG
jgi:two-component system, OmpR family, response regulator